MPEHHILADCLESPAIGIQTLSLKAHEIDPFSAFFSFFSFELIYYVYASRFLLLKLPILEMNACSRIGLPIGRHMVLLLLSLLLGPRVFITPIVACSNGDCQLLDSCSTATDCGAGLYCGNCPPLGKTLPFCVRGQATIPTSIISGLPFNKYTWLVTHNAFSIVDAPSLTGAQRVTFYNQEDTVTNQLRNGVRGLMLDMYDFENDIWLCHSFRGQCYNFTAFEPAVNTLKEVEAFLTQNPSEIVTIIIEDYVRTPKGLTKVFADAGLDKYWYPVAKMPNKGHDWPTVNNMVQNNYRLLVFTSDSSKESTEGIAHQWKYMKENEPGDPGEVPSSCPHRKESKPLKSRSASLFLMNYFPTMAVQNEACKEHSTPLAEMVATCYRSSGNLMPNFIAVNFYMRSDGGGVFDNLDRMNGQTLCGCSTVSSCQAGAPFGSCKAIPVANTTQSTAGTAGSFSGSVQLIGAASTPKAPGVIFLCWSLFLTAISLL